MKLFVPDYYRSFKCIADKCRHNCCIGWEIDIDEQTSERYERITGALGKRLKCNVSREGGAPHFVTDENGRCPFLNQRGLCDIITELGEDALCDICREHPRFRNYFSDRIEVGLGLSCEEAARIVLLNDKPMRLICLEETEEEGLEQSGEEREFLVVRDRLFEILQNRNKDIFRRMKECERHIGITAEPVPKEKLKGMFLGLEYMDAAVGSKIAEAIEVTENICVTDETETVIEQAAVYFVYRYLPDGLYGGDIAERLALAFLNTRVLHALCELWRRKNGALASEYIVDIAREYSAEIEYSEENIAEMLDFLSAYITYEIG